MRHLVRRTPLTRRVAVAGTAAVLLVGGAGAALWGTADQLHDAQQFRSDQLGVAAQADDRLLQEYVDEETGLRGYLLTGQPDFLTPYTQAQSTLPGTTATLRTGYTASGGPEQLLNDLAGAHDAWSAFAQQQIDLARAGRLDEARSTATTGYGKRLFDTIRSRNADVASWLDGAERRSEQRVTGLQRRLVVLLVVALVALLVLVAAGWAELTRAVTRPLSRLAAATRTVAGGDLDADLPADGAPEVRALATDVRAMRDRLTAELHTAQRVLGSLEQTGPAVAALRAALEPAAEPVAGLAVAARLDPAEGVLAGDWYDTVALGPARMGLVLGDVAGHGPAAAVFALRLKHSLLSALRAGLDPGRALTQLSGELADVPAGQFATVLVAVADTAAGTLTWANAGHPAGLLLGGVPGEVVELPATGPLLSSIVSGWAWNTATRPFPVGCSLLAFTDGVLETRDADGREFGTRGVLDAVADVGLTDGERLIGAIAAASMRFHGHLARRDDHTVVHVRRLPGADVPAGRQG